MTKKLLAICLAAIGFAGLFQVNASANEAVASAPAQTAGLHAPSGIVRINQAVVIETGRRHRYYRHRSYRRHGYYRHHRYYRHRGY